jgi:hypothetical protein
VVKIEDCAGDRRRRRLPGIFTVDVNGNNLNMFQLYLLPYLYLNLSLSFFRHSNEDRCQSYTEKKNERDKHKNQKFFLAKKPLNILYSSRLSNEEKRRNFCIGSEKTKKKKPRKKKSVKTN